LFGIAALKQLKRDLTKRKKFPEEIPFFISRKAFSLIGDLLTRRHAILVEERSCSWQKQLFQKKLPRENQGRYYFEATPTLCRPKDMLSALNKPSKSLVLSFPASSSLLAFFVTKISTLPAKVGKRERNLISIN